MRKKPTLLGLTGAFGSGKTTASSFFVENGFERITLSSFLEEELHRRSDAPITRKALQDLGNEWRQQHGNGILAKKALSYIDEKNVEFAVIDGIRNLGEVDIMRKQQSFSLIAIVLNRVLRFERLKKNPRRETLTWDLFRELDYRDLGVGENDSGLQAGLCIALADIFVDNNGSPEIFKEKLKEVFMEEYA